jgi:hypothetical protein
MIPPLCLLMGGLVAEIYPGGGRPCGFLAGGTGSGKRPCSMSSPTQSATKICFVAGLNACLLSHHQYLTALCHP